MHHIDGKLQVAFGEYSAIRKTLRRSSFSIGPAQRVQECPHFIWEWPLVEKQTRQLTWLASPGSSGIRCGTETALE